MSKIRYFVLLNTGGALGSLGAFRSLGADEMDTEPDPEWSASGVRLHFFGSEPYLIFWKKSAAGSDPKSV